MKYDVFVSYASEDRQDFVEELAFRLQSNGLTVWYDNFELKLGDSLTESINEGLSNSAYGVVVLSPHFFSKSWPQRELRAMLSREEDGRKLVLPVWHKLTRDRVMEHSSFLADKLAVLSNRGVDAVVDEILKVIRPRVQKPPAKESGELVPLKQTVDLFSDFIFMINLSQSGLYNNNSFVTVLGFDAIAVVCEGEGVGSLFKDKGVYDKIYREVLNYQYWQGDVEMRTASGKIVDIYLRVVCAQSEESKFISFVGTDVTYNKRRQNLLKRYNSVLKAQSEASNEGILVVNERNIISNFNNRFTKIWGLTPSLMDVGNPDRIWTIIFDKIKKPDELRKAIESHDSSREFAKEGIIQTIDERMFEWRMVPISSPLGEVYGHTWFFHEITSQLLSELSLLDSLFDKPLK